MESPTYLAAIQSFGLMEARFKSVPLLEDGADLDAVKRSLDENRIKLFYSVTNFQNPTGITYSQKKREMLADILKDRDTIFVEDNPYGEIRFLGEDIPPVKKYLDSGVLFGSFSKIVSPGMRLGWIVAPDEVMEKLVTAKQASDLHSNYFTQRVVYQYLTDNDVDKHIENIKAMYRDQRNLMVEMIEEYFPEDVKITRPEGGMFLWVEVPGVDDTVELFKKCLEHNVAFVPGDPFYAGKPQPGAFRLNYSNAKEDQIKTGMKQLGEALQ